MNLITAPAPLIATHQFSVFLAGSIAGDTAEQWQDTVIESLQKESITVLNPRRAS